ncbi:MAG: hypothetical protein V4792_05020 [Pseudomonadota bacterium]
MTDDVKRGTVTIEVDGLSHSADFTIAGDLLTVVSPALGTNSGACGATPEELARKLLRELVVDDRRVRAAAHADKIHALEARLLMHRQERDGWKDKSDYNYEMASLLVRSLEKELQDLLEELPIR